MSENQSEEKQLKSEEKQEVECSNNKTDDAKKQEISKEHDIEVEDISEQSVERAAHNVIQSEFSGPIPPPNIIRGYEEIVPGAADRIITMAENQSKHRQDMERIMVESESRDSLLGVLFAFFLGISCVIAAIVMVIMVPENAGAIAGAALGMTGIGSIIATFIKGTRVSSRKE